MNISPFIIERTNLSVAWKDAMEKIMQEPGQEITPLIVTLTGFDETEIIKKSLDLHLQTNKHGSIQTVSETIFPQTLYKLNKYDRHGLYHGYLDILPRIKKIDASSNGRGTYFERLIAFDVNGQKINQLEIIISGLKKNGPRRSKLQASIFDPSKDHTNGPFQRFPCLQHVTFYVNPHGGLVLNSFYAIQYLYERAYGNWLGLVNLGKFVAHELDLEFERFNCFIGVEKLEISKKVGQQILKDTN
jgi:hypothetical protein